MATGAVAYDLLAHRDPEAVAAVVALERSHPDWSRFEARLGDLKGSARDRLLFALMARWPDDARGGPLDHPSWHLDLRLIPDPDSPSPVLARAPAGAADSLVAGEARTAFDLALATVRDASAPASERAIALCWLFHLVGDIHQPLHAGQLVSAAYPLSDSAGGAEKVRSAPGAPPIGLHAFWDAALDLDKDDAVAADEIAGRLERSEPSAAPPSGAPEAAFRGWAQESYLAAATDAYPGRHAVAGPRSDPAPVLDPAYVARAKVVAEARMALAGGRLAWVVEAAMNSPMERLLRQTASAPPATAGSPPR